MHLDTLGFMLYLVQIALVFFYAVSLLKGLLLCKGHAAQNYWLKWSIVAQGALSAFKLAGY